MATAQNNGQQDITLAYKEPGKSNDFNHLLRHLTNPGVYAGGDIERLVQTNLTLSPSILLITPWVCAINVNDIINGDDKMVRVQGYQKAIVNLQSLSAPNSYYYIYGIFNHNANIFNFMDFRIFKYVLPNDVNYVSNLEAWNNITNKVVFGSVTTDAFGILTGSNSTNDIIARRLHRTWGLWYEGTAYFQNNVNIYGDLVLNNPDNPNPNQAIVVNNVKASRYYDKDDEAFYVDPHSTSNMKDLVLTGNLTVLGTETKLSTNSIETKDPNISMNKGGDASSANGAGITIVDSGNAFDPMLYWDNINKIWKFQGDSELDTHILDTNNPHNVTKLQIGLNSLLDERQIINGTPANRIELSWNGELNVEIDNAILTPAYNLARQNHIHTKADIGLGLVENAKQVINKFSAPIKLDWDGSKPLIDINNAAAILELLTKNNGSNSYGSWINIGDFTIQFGTIHHGDVFSNHISDNDGSGGDRALVRLPSPMPPSNINYELYSIRPFGNFGGTFDYGINDKTTTDFQIHIGENVAAIQNVYFTWLIIGKLS